MKKLSVILVCIFFLSCSMASFAQQNIPYLKKQGSATQLIVNDQPFLMLGGELGNSTAASYAKLEEACIKMEKMNLNTMLVPAYWELIEPQENQFNFASIDQAIGLARKYNLKIVFLWFGSWKNSMTCYAPLWVKENYKKYPRAVTKSGKPLEILSAFSESNLNIDKKAFVKFMNHIATVDKDQNTIIMIQVENEIGMLEDAREYGKIADKAFDSQVPQQLIDYITKNKQTLRPQLLERWKESNYATKGNWNELFGEGLETDEMFMAWGYASFVQELARAGKQSYNLPMYINAALNSRGRKPGQYPSAGPLAHLLDIWRAGAPDIDFLAPDIYDPGFPDWCAQYHINGNPLFIPEIKFEEANAARVFYAFGEHDAMGFSPFSIENPNKPEEYPLKKSYDILHQLLPLLKEKQGFNKTNGFLFDNDTKEKSVERNGYKITFKHDYTLGWNPESKNESPWSETGALIIELSQNEYLIAGTGVVVTFENTKNDGMITGIGYIDDVKFENGKMISLQRLNGDQNHQGRHLRIPAGEWGIQYIKLYDYK